MSSDQFLSVPALVLFVPLTVSVHTPLGLVPLKVAKVLVGR